MGFLEPRDARDWWAGVSCGVASVGKAGSRKLENFLLSRPNRTKKDQRQSEKGRMQKEAGAQMTLLYAASRGYDAQVPEKTFNHQDSINK